METLTLEQLAPYLPYGIPAKLSQKGIFNQDDEYPNPRTKEIGIIKNISFWYPEITGQLHISETYSFDFDEIDEVDILLRPLTDLTKEIEHNGESFVVIDILEQDENNDYLADCNIWTQKLFEEQKILSLEFIPYGVMQILFMYHFDVFGLIPKGLAKDINQIK